MGIGPLADQAVPALIDGLADSDPEIRRISAGVLGRIGTKAAPAVPTLRDRLQDEVPNVRWAAEDALKRIQRTP